MAVCVFLPIFSGNTRKTIEIIVDLCYTNKNINMQPRCTAMEMDKNKYEIVRLRMERTAKALRRNNMVCECAENAAEALDILQDMLDEWKRYCRRRLDVAYGSRRARRASSRGLSLS